MSINIDSNNSLGLVRFMEYLFTPRVHYHEYSLRGTFCISKVPETYKVLWPFPKDIITDHNQCCSQKKSKSWLLNAGTSSQSERCSSNWLTISQASVSETHILKSVVVAVLPKIRDLLQLGHSKHLFMLQ